MIAVFFHLTAKDLRVLIESNIFVVRLEAAAKKTGDLPLDNLYVDNLAAAYRATGDVLEQGHEHIAMIAGKRGPGEWRLLGGYRRALSERHGLLDESFIEDRDFTVEGGYEGMRALLARSPRPTAVFAANDLMAIGALKAVREAGLRVPKDIAIVGFDDIPAAALVSPALTTITQFPARLGRRAVEMLFERLNGTAPQRGRSIEMPFELIVRESA